jgi:hypothetical protein
MLKRKNLKQDTPCPCCGYLVYSKGGRNKHLICPICFWEDDPSQLEDMDLAEGANKVSLNTARNNFDEYGVSDMDDKSSVREPLPEEKRLHNWNQIVKNKEQV